MTAALTHVAMSVPPGRLDARYRAEVIDFYGRHFGWTDMTELTNSERLILAVGSCYVNIRERDEPMACSGYEHFGVGIRDGAQVEAIWKELDASGLPLELSHLNRGADGYRSFKFRHLLPLAVEVQHFPT